MRAGTSVLELNPRALEYLSGRLQPFRAREQAQAGRRSWLSHGRELALVQLLSSLQHLPALCVSSARPGVRWVAPRARALRVQLGPACLSARPARAGTPPG